MARTEAMASLAFRHMQKCHEEAVQKVEAAKTEAEGLAKGIPTQRGSITRSIGIGNPPTCSREWRLHPVREHGRARYVAFSCTLDPMDGYWRPPVPKVEKTKHLVRGLSGQGGTTSPPKVVCKCIRGRHHAKTYIKR